MISAAQAHKQTAQRCVHSTCPPVVNHPERVAGSGAVDNTMPAYTKRAYVHALKSLSECSSSVLRCPDDSATCQAGHHACAHNK